MSPDWLQWILGGAIGIVGAFATYIWKELTARTKETETELKLLQTDYSNMLSEIKLLKQGCANNHTGVLKGDDMRKILDETFNGFRDELNKFKDDLRSSIMKDIQLALYKGEISVPSPPKRTRKAKA